MTDHFIRLARHRAVHIDAKHITFSVSEWYTTGLPTWPLARGRAESVILIDFGNRLPTIGDFGCAEEHPLTAKRMASRRIALAVMHFQLCSKIHRQGLAYGHFQSHDSFHRRRGRKRRGSLWSALFQHALDTFPEIPNSRFGHATVPSCKAGDYQ